MNFSEWKKKVLELHPAAMFTMEDGNGLTYADLSGAWTAHTGLDMQADVVGVFVPGKLASWDTDITISGNRVWTERPAT